MQLAGKGAHGHVHRVSVPTQSTRRTSCEHLFRLDERANIQADARGRLGKA